VWLAGCTPEPHAAWRAQQARSFSLLVEDWKLPCRYLVHDRDTSFAALDGVLKTHELDLLKTPPRTPLCNAYAERHVREIRETLDCSSEVLPMGGGSFRGGGPTHAVR
jgi:hypothetical protein